jgi:hypothetical protein
VHTSLKRLKIISKWRIGGSTEFTHWGDIDHIFQHTNHYTKDRSGNIDWDLEVEEGWILHNIFSTHFLQENKVVIHTYDPGLEFLNNNYSLCQGNIAMPSKSHALAEHYLRQSVCPECRSSLSAKFYKMMGLQSVMPLGHEYNHCNLPFDQLPVL